MTNANRPVRLRAIEPDDLDLLYKVENDRSLWKTGNTNVPYSKELLRQYILTTTGDIYADRQLRLIIEIDGDDGRDNIIIGIVDLVNFDPRNSRAEVGIVILDTFRHCGYASHVLERLSVYGRDMLHIHQLYALIAVDNAASRRLFTKCGYRECAVLEDWLRDGEGYGDAVLMRKLL